MSGLSELVTPLWREKLVKDSWTDWSQATLCNCWEGDRRWLKQKGL